MTVTINFKKRYFYGHVNIYNLLQYQLQSDHHTTVLHKRTFQLRNVIKFPHDIIIITSNLKGHGPNLEH